MPEQQPLIMPAPRQRNQAIDLMRATCILWIVGFWHPLG
ncbi:hypothetical protein BBFGKLBO_01578 [Synechococcus sp. CBW1107]|jgi:hypothetical protein|nr:hypothetical protein BBFGKLBO_01578 [Synechococcus sp. CBW1107]